MGIDNALFRHELAGNARGFSRDHKIEVVFDGDGARTDGSTIILPGLNDALDLAEHDMRVMRGYVDHEAAHIRHTELGLMREAMEKGGPLLKSLLNALEDVRIDRLTISEFGGAAKNLRATAAQAVTAGLKPALDREPHLVNDPVAASAVLITMMGRTHIGLGSDVMDDLIVRFDPRFRSWALAYARRASVAANTREVYRLAEEAMADIVGDPQDKPQQPQQQPDQGKGEEQKRKEQDGQRGDGRGFGGSNDADDEEDDDEGLGQDEDGDGEGDEDGEQGGSSGDGGDGGGEARKGEGDGDDDGDDDGGDEGGQKGRGGSGQAKRGGKGDDDGDDGGVSRGWTPGSMKGGSGAGQGGGVIDAGMASALNDIAQAHKKKTPQSPPIRVMCPDAGGHVNLDDPGWKGKVQSGAHAYVETVIERAKRLGAQEYDNVRAKELTGVIGVMTREFERLMASSMQRDKVRNLEQGRLDARRLTAAYLGATNVFWRRGDRVEVDTAVEVLVDASSSMSGSRAHMTRLALIAICEAMERAGIEFAVRAFTSVDLDKELSQRVDKIVQSKSVPWMERYHSAGNHLVMDLKSYGQRMAKARRFLGIAHLLPSGGTPLGDAMFAVWPILAKRTERRKVMLVLTDGAPDASHVVLRAVKDMQAKEVECIGVGINTDAVRNLFPNWATVTDVGSLTGETLSQLRRALIPSQRRVAA